MNSDELWERYVEAPAVIKEWVSQLLLSREAHRVIRQNRHHQIDCMLFARSDHRVMHPRLTISLLDDGIVQHISTIELKEE